MEFPKTLTVNVTEKEIKEGEPDNCRECAVARAVQDIFPEYLVDVDDKIRIRIDVNGRNWGVWDAIYPLPFEAEQFIRAFDRGEEVRPFTFNTEKQ